MRRDLDDLDSPCATDDPYLGLSEAEIAGITADPRSEHSGRRGIELECRSTQRRTTVEYILWRRTYIGQHEVESTYIPDPNAQTARPEDDDEVAIREITSWRDGFSIADGPLLKYDDPANQAILSAINSGSAPPSVLNVRVGQPVELRVAQRTKEDYRPPPPKPATPFSGSGNRLGAPAPSGEASGSGSGSTSMPGTFANSEPESIRTMFEVDNSQPTTSIQAYMSYEFDHTVGDIRSFINASTPGAASRLYTIGTTFPNRILEDPTQTVEAAGIKGSVVVQRWV
ncbi:SEP protein [Rhizoctonia solani]|uniref:SEP protein n=1 Tax=Rhizoctonia solani TaxID=456999 RepID=A0A8H7ICX4_9AGAM|nr:SEP protein [Rhizoctonia solani]